MPERFAELMGGAGQTPWWMSNAHLQTIVPAIWCSGEQAHYQVIREKWITPDGDFLEVHRIPPKGANPTLVLFHGLEGGASSHYVQAFSKSVVARGWGFVLPHFRGCGREINFAPRAYHSGDHVEMDWILRKLKSETQGLPLLAVGVSLGGNALMKWAGEHSHDAVSVVAAAAAISSPLDLVASGLTLGRGFNRQVYTRMFLKTMLPKATQKWNQYPGLFDLAQLRNATTLFEFDDLFTAPLHGFQNAMDYWQKASAKPVLIQVKVPSLLVNAINDPFVPSASLPNAHEVSEQISLWQPRQGGHVGFPMTPSRSKWGFSVSVMPNAVTRWLGAQIAETNTTHRKEGSHG